MAQAAPSSSPFTYTYTHDVFLSFRGPDTRLGFTGNLYSALCQRGVMTFIDDDGLRRGEEITASLLKAIKDSRMAIIIFSKNFASSPFCLNELVQVLECSKEKGQHIWPIFYDVDPSEVRHQKGTFGEAFTKHELVRFKDNIQKLEKWKSALNEAANLSGWHFKQQGGEYEHEFIKKVVDEVSGKLNRPLLHVANYPVGLQAHKQNVKTLLDAKFDNKAKMLGIYGIGGIGKSTIARTIYNLIVDQFEGSCFVANVREKSVSPGLVQIQETILSQLVGERKIKLGDVSIGISMLKERLHRKKVLVILDDVDNIKQLEATAGGLDWFGSGSIIIITTRDKHLLDIHGVEKPYEVNELNHTEALELFRWNAFKNKEVDPSYMEIMKRVIQYAGGLPLALETIGSSLFGKTVGEWKSALEACERIPNKDVQKILRVSYDGLQENEKEMFLDIACFFKGCTERYVTSILHARGFHPEYGMRVLEEKSLIKILIYDFNYGEDNVVTMHDLIQIMGKEIVRQQSTWSHKRNRLWFHDDIVHILRKNTENYKIEAIMLDMPESEKAHCNLSDSLHEVFDKMKNLRMLIKKCSCNLKNPEHLPDSLKVLEWWGYPLDYVPFDLQKKLILLNLSHSSCFQWGKPLEKSESLSHLIFRGCVSIRQIPDVSSSPNLTELCVDDCKNLIEIHDSVGFLSKLQRFSAKGCTKLRIVPRGIMLTSLEYLCLRDCSSLNIFPEILGPMEKLKFVDFQGTAIENLPRSMQNLGGLQSLSLSRCTMLNIDALSYFFQSLPIFFPLLGVLTLDGSNLRMIPKCIEECHSLKDLSVKDCKQLLEIRGLPQNIRSMDATNCTSLNIHTSNELLKQIFQHGCTIKRSFWLTGKKLPKLFDFYNRGNSVFFRFREGIPDITVGVVTGGGNIEYDINFKINNDFETNCFTFFSYSCSGQEEIFIFNDLQAIVSSCPTLHLLDNWNYAEILFLQTPNSYHLGMEPVRWSGVYVNQENTSRDDIEFINRYLRRNGHGDSSYSNQPILFSGRQPYDHASRNSGYQKWPLPWTIEAISDQQEMAAGESSQAQGFGMTQNVQAQSATLSSGEVNGEELDLSLRNQIDVEIEAFYASLDKKDNTTPSEHATREALKIVQDFMSRDTSFFLDPEQCSLMKTNLDYLFNLSEDDGISGEMLTLILEASREFTHWSKEYNEASLKIESTASQLKRADKLIADLEDNKKQFREVMTKENVLLQKLARMEKSKKELEEQINALKADIYSSQSEKNMASQRKRDIFKEGKMLKTQRDELREKEPHLQHEHDLAKETQTRIEDEWSRLGEKFKKIFVE